MLSMEYDLKSSDRLQHQGKSILRCVDSVVAATALDPGVHVDPGLAGVLVAVVPVVDVDPVVDMDPAAAADQGVVVRPVQPVGPSVYIRAELWKEIRSNLASRCTK